jgi:hypothetical protein
MAKKIGIIVLLCFSLCVGGVSAFANEGHAEADTQALIETQSPVSSVLFRQSGADIQQSVQTREKHGKAILPSRKQTTSLMMNFPHGLKMKRKIFKSWSMLENGQKQKRQKHLSITMKSLNLF